MKILMAASESYPFAKTGGLGDVLGSLPPALQKEGADVRVVLPRYGTIGENFRQEMVHRGHFTVPLGWRRQYCGLAELEHQGVTYCFLDNEYYFRRERIYDFHDEAERFGFFSRAVFEMIRHSGFVPDILHTHDWQTAMAGVFLKTLLAGDPLLRDIRNVYTIHNLKYQGVFPRSVLTDVLGLPESLYAPEGIEFFGNISYMKGGIRFADRVTTVSHSYAREITTPAFGERLEGVLAARGDLTGIENGIDTGLYDPENDPALVVPIQKGKEKQGKAGNKKALQQELGLDRSADTPLVAVISRLVSQKGLDLIREVLPEILREDLQLVVLGTGEPAFEEMFRQAALGHPGRVAARICYDENLAHRIYAGADLFLMPSLFEPCGLAQMMAMRYGTVPLVRETGGLKDTVAPYNEYTGEGFGFTFREPDARDMLYTLKRALGFYRNPTAWNHLVTRVMARDHSWGHAAKQYLELYGQLPGGKDE